MYHDYCIIGACISFFVLTSGRPLPVTTFFVFSKPLCSHFAAQIVIREFSAPLQKRCLSLSKGFPLQPKFAAAAAQRFYSSFAAPLEAILAALQQHCSFRTGFFFQKLYHPKLLWFIHMVQWCCEILIWLISRVTALATYFIIYTFCTAQWCWVIFVSLFCE